MFTTHLPDSFALSQPLGATQSRLDTEKVLSRQRVQILFESTPGRPEVSEGAKSENTGMG